MEQQLLTLPEHLSSHPGFSLVRVTRFLALCFADRCLSFCTFFGVILLSVLLFTDSDTPLVSSNSS